MTLAIRKVPVELGEASLGFSLTARAGDVAEHFRPQMPELVQRAGESHAIEQAGDGPRIEVVDGYAEGFARPSHGSLPSAARPAEAIERTTAGIEREKQALDE